MTLFWLIFKLHEKEYLCRDNIYNLSNINLQMTLIENDYEKLLDSVRILNNAGSNPGSIILHFQSVVCKKSKIAASKFPT